MSEITWEAVAKRIREKATHQKASYPDKQTLAVAEAIEELLSESVPND